MNLGRNNVIILFENSNFFQNPYFIVARQISPINVKSAMYINEVLESVTFCHIFELINQSMVQNFHSVSLPYVLNAMPRVNFDTF